MLRAAPAADRSWRVVRRQPLRYRGGRDLDHDRPAHVRAASAVGWGPAAHYCLRASDAPTIELRHETGATSPHRDTFISGMWGANDNFGGAATLNVFNDGTAPR